MTAPSPRVSLPSSYAFTLALSFLIHGAFFLVLAQVFLFNERTRDLPVPIREVKIEILDNADVYDWQDEVLPVVEPEIPAVPAPAAETIAEPVEEAVQAPDAEPVPPPVLESEPLPEAVPEPLPTQSSSARMAPNQEVTTSFKTETPAKSTATLKKISFKSLSQGRKLKAPSYPAAARRWKQEGIVKVSLKIDAEGRVTEVLIAESSGFTILDNQVLKTLESWVFNPPGKSITLMKKFVFRLEK